MSAPAGAEARHSRRRAQDANGLRVLLEIPRSPLFRTLLVDVLAAGAWAAFVTWLELAVLGPAVSLSLSLGPAILQVLGIILGLLLVFRTNTAYDRWWEGRRLWGQLLNVTRALAHQLDALLPRDAPQRARYAELLGAYPAALAAHLRRARGAPGGHEPNRLVRELSRLVHGDVAAGALPREAAVALTPLLVGFDDITGACERIRNTPIPRSYSAYIKQFVLVYALVLPFGLVREFRYGTVFASMLVFFATMGLELLAAEIEQPFGTDRNDLPLDEIAARAAGDARELLGAG